MHKHLLVFLATTFLFVQSGVSANGLELPKIDRRPAPEKWPWWRRLVPSVRQYDPNSTDPFQVDLRGRNLSGLDLSDALANLQYATFDDQTVWPSAEKMPARYDYEKIMELGRTTASQTGTDDYVFYRQGGWSWSIPYIGKILVS